MSETTPVLGLQLTAAGQAQKHVTVNEALLRLDALVHLAVIERNRNAPPASPANGDRYLVGTAPTGVYAGQAGAVASFDAGAWTFLAPRRGWRAHVQAENALLVFDGTVWNGFSPTGPIQNIALLGLGTTADATNPLAVKVNNALFAANSAPGGTGDLRLKLNKDASANTLSQLYQTGYSGRAETGLIGNDRFAVKVSPDGSNWKLALDIDPATGVVSAPFGLAGDRAAFRNRLINGDFRINQRAVYSAVTLAADAYGHDRWKGGVAGCTYSFATSAGVTTVTITANTLRQDIESINIDGTAFVLAWTGTATARVWQGSASGSYAASPIIVTGLTANTNTVVEFSTGTVSKVQFEPGAVATAFEFRPLSVELRLAQRYFWKTYEHDTSPGTPNGGGAIGTTSISGLFILSVAFPVEMRATPTVVFYGFYSGATGNYGDGSGIDKTIGGIATSSRHVVTYYAANTSANGSVYTHFTASAEI